MRSSFQIVALGVAAVFAAGCNSAPAPLTKPAAVPAVAAPAVMDAKARAVAAQAAAAHPAFKLKLQKIDMPAVVVVAESTTDDQLKDLLWYLRAEVQDGKFRELGLHPTTTGFAAPGYGTGSIAIYRGERCAHEMYVASGPDPCGASIHKSATYHWGDAGDRTADSADIVRTNGADDVIFTSADGWQSDDDARRDSSGQLRQAARARVQYVTKQNAKSVKQSSDIRFYIDQPNDALGMVSYQFATDAGQKAVLDQFLTLESDHLCPLGFTTIKLGVRGAAGKPYPIPCSTK